MRSVRRVGEAGTHPTSTDHVSGPIQTASNGETVGKNQVNSLYTTPITTYHNIKHVNATYRWVESEARRVLREVLNAREQERRQEVTPPVARTRRTRREVSDDDEGDDDDDANSVGAGAAA